MADRVADSSELSPEMIARFNELGARIGISGPVDFSNLAAPTLKKWLSTMNKPVFSSAEMPVADSVADSQKKGPLKRGTRTPVVVTTSKQVKSNISRKIFTSRSGFIYRKARLVQGSTWYIVFYCTDIDNKKLFRKRVLKDELAAITDRTQRMTYARNAMREINQMLFNDWHTADHKPFSLAPLKFDFSHYTLLAAIDYVAGIKKDVEGVRPTTIKEYNATKSTLVDFMQHASISQDLLLRHLSDTFLTKYFDYLKQVRGSTNKTYNARRTMLHAVMNTLIKRDPKLFGGVNPIARVKFLKVNSNTHSAYSDQQMIQIRDAILKGNEAHLLFFIQFMYYTLSRPKELRLLKIGDIDLVNQRILFRAEISKTVIEQHVGINEKLLQLINHSGIMAYPPSYYIFSNSIGGSHPHTPGPTPVASSYFYKRIKPYITALGFARVNQNYTLYSFKHTGAIALYRATKDIKLIQAQCRHQSIEQTNIYLKDLGVLSDFDQLNRWNGPI